MGLTFWIVLFGLNAWSVGVSVGAVGKIHWIPALTMVICAYMIRATLVKDYARMEEDEDEQ